MQTVECSSHGTGPAAPQIDNRLPVDHDGSRGAEFFLDFEVFDERLHDRAETFLVTAAQREFIAPRRQALV
jgi:hypothetical protein